MTNQSANKINVLKYGTNLKLIYALEIQFN